MCTSTSTIECQDMEPGMISGVDKHVRIFDLQMLTNTQQFPSLSRVWVPRESVICFEVNEPCYIRKCGKMGFLLTVKMRLVGVSRGTVLKGGSEQFLGF